jgi:predicted permease
MLRLESMGRDLKLSVRSLVREKTFTVTALLILSLCFAANVAIFAVVNGVLLQPLPFFAPHQLVLVGNAYPKAGVERSGASVPHYLERKELAAFADVAAIRDWGVTIGEAGSPERIDASYVTPSFFRLLGVNPALGRTFSDDEGFYGKNNVVVISDGLWRQRFGADPAIVGKTLRVDTTPHTIVGVMPAGFRYLSQRAKLWTPLCFSDDERKADRRHSNNMAMIARLKPGVTVAEAQAQVDALNEQTLKTDPFAKIVRDAGFHTTVRDLGDDYVAELRPVLLLLQVGVLFLLLIGGVNLANLFLVRATGRTKEYCVRQALGAGWAQLARGVFAESLVLSLAGVALGLALGAVALRGLAALGTEQLPVQFDAHLDATVIGAAVLVGLVVAVALATPVIWHALKGNLTAALSVESRGGTTTRSVHRLRHALIVAQIALAFVLLAGTGLLGLSFARVMAQNPGFRPEHVVSGGVALPWSNYKDDKPRLAFVEKLLAELQAMPGIAAAGISTGAPFSGNDNDNAIWVEGYQLAPGESLRAHFTSGVAGDFFGVMGIPLREGRLLTAADLRDSNRVCVVDETMARHYWPKGGAVGHRVSNGPPEKDTDYFTIVGVVGHVAQDDLTDRKAIGAVYYPYRWYSSNSFSVLVRTSQRADLAGPALRAAVLRIDPELPLHDLKTMTSRIDESVAGRRVPLLLAGVFATVALILAAVGIYGVLAYTVTQRQREIGVRLALGARPEQILAQFIGLGTRLLVLALPIGLAGAWLAGRAMTTLLFGVAPANALVLGGTAAMLAGVALLACLIPSRRAARVSPVEALRAN